MIVSTCNLCQYNYSLYFSVIILKPGSLRIKFTRNKNKEQSTGLEKCDPGKISEQLITALCKREKQRRMAATPG